MKKAIKYFSITIITLFLLVIIGVGILVTVVNPNSLKAPISQQVQKLTGRQLVIAGNVSWSFFPWLGLQVNNVQLDNPIGVTPEVFASVQKLSVSLRLWPLLEGQFKIGKLYLNKLVLDLQRQSDGTNNWQDLMSSKQIKKAQTSDSAIKKSKFILAPMALTISSIKVSDANIHYSDQQLKRDFYVQDLKISSKNIQFDKLFPVRMSFDFKAINPNKSKSGKSGKIRLNTQVFLNTKAQAIRFVPFAANIQLNNKRAGKEGVHFSLESLITFDLADGVMKLEKLQGQLVNATFNGQLTGKQIFDKPVFSGTMKILRFNPRLFLQGLGKPVPKTKEPNMLQEASANTQLVISENSFLLKDLTINLDESILKGNIFVHDPSQKTSTFDLNLNKIDLDCYLPTTKKAKPKVDTVTSKRTPFSSLRKLNLKGRLRVGDITIKGLTANNFNLTVVAQNGIINTSRFANLYNGNYKGDSTMDVRGDTPKFNLNERFTNIDVGLLFDTFSSSKRFKILGVGNITAKLSSRGQTGVAFIKALNGSATFNLNNGTLKGISLERQLNIATSLVDKKPLPKRNGSNETPFKSLTGTAQITNGVVKNRDLILQSDILKVTGAGYLNLSTNAINYIFRASAVEGKVDPRVIKIQEMLGGAIPIKISGVLPSYKIRPEPTAILKGVAQFYLKKHTKKIRKEVDKQIKGLGDKLIKIFN